MKEIIDKLDFIEMKNVFSVKEISREWEMMNEKIFTNDTSDLKTNKKLHPKYIKNSKLSKLKKN